MLETPCDCVEKSDEGFYHARCYCANSNDLEDAAHWCGVQNERERCAKLAEQMDKSTHPADVADAIRAQS